MIYIKRTHRHRTTYYLTQCIQQESLDSKRYQDDKKKTCYNKKATFSNL